MSRASQTERLNELYDRLPTVECKQLCQKFCGPLVLTPLEYKRLPKKPPFMERHGPLLHVGHDNALCRVLKDGLCSAYDRRPLICRLFGVWRDLACPYGCVPTRWIDTAEAKALMAEVERIGN